MYDQLVRLSTLSLCLAAALAVSPAHAADLGIAGVGDSPVECDPIVGLNNCARAEIDRVTCPAGVKPLGVQVRLLNIRETSDLFGLNPDETANPSPPPATLPGQDGCLQVLQLAHTKLELAVPNAPNPLIVDGAGGALPPAAALACVPAIDQTGDAPPRRRFYREAGGPAIADPGILVSTKPNLTTVYPPGNPNFDYFYGDASQKVLVELSAQASQNIATSGTFQAQIVTSAIGSIELFPICDNDGQEVPAIGAVGIGALGLGLSGIGLVLGFRRRS